MFKVIATNVVISKGYDGAPALKFSENGDSVRFRIGKKVYDPNAENNSRWINMPAKAFGKVCEHVKNMKLKEGSFINLIGRLDEDSWTDKTTNEKKSIMVIILDDVEYTGGGGKTKEGQMPNPSTAPADDTPQQAAAPEPQENFTGYEPFGGGGSFF